MKSPPSSTNMTSSTGVGSSCSSLSSPRDGVIGQLQRENLDDFPQQQQDGDAEECQYDRGQNSDCDLYEVNGKTERNRRFREFVPDVEKDEVYWEKRRKNNEAARRSREKRRINDIVLAGRINILEQDNTRLRRELTALKKKYQLSDGHMYEDKNRTSRQSDIRGVGASSFATVVNNNNLSRPNELLGPYRKPSSQIHHRSPPPLLAVTDSMPLGLTVFSSGANPGLPYFVSEPTHLNHNSFPKTKPSSYAIGLPQYHDQHMPLQQARHQSYIKDTIKDIGEARDGGVRGRSMNNVGGLPYLLDPSLMSMLKRNSVLSYPQYCHPLCSPNSEIGHHSYNSSHSSPANHLYHFQNLYDKPALLQTSSVFTHSIDDNYDEPLQLTVRRDNKIPKNNWDSNDINCKESASNVPIGEKPKLDDASPSSSAPLNLHHKPPSLDMVIPSPLFPLNIAPVSSSLKQPYSDPSFLIGLTNLPDHEMAQANPQSLATSELPFPFSQRKLASVRSGKVLTKCLDPIYLERRRKNNEAARKCRENRRSLIKFKEDKPTCLDTENSKLKIDLTCLQKEMKQLRDLIKSKQTEENIQQEPNLVES